MLRLASQLPTRDLCILVAPTYFEKESKNSDVVLEMRIAERTSADVMMASLETILRGILHDDSAIIHVSYTYLLGKICI